MRRVDASSDHSTRRWGKIIPWVNLSCYQDLACQLFSPSLHMVQSTAYNSYIFWILKRFPFMRCLVDCIQMLIKKSDNYLHYHKSAYEYPTSYNVRVRRVSSFTKWKELVLATLPIMILDYIQIIMFDGYTCQFI